MRGRAVVLPVEEESAGMVEAEGTVCMRMGSTR